MKLKKLLNCIIPIAACSIAIPTVVGCSNGGGEDDPVEEGKFDIVHSDGTIDHYDKFEKAIEKVKKDDTVLLHEDVTLDEKLFLSSFINVTIDGCGHSISLMNSTMDGVLCFNNCYNTTLKNISIFGKTSMYGVGLNYGAINFDSVNVIGSFGDYDWAVTTNTEMESFNIKNCYFDSIKPKKSASVGLYLRSSADNEGVFNIDNSYIDSISLEYASVRTTKIIFGENVHTRFIKVDDNITSANLNTAIKNLSKVQDLLFLGHAHTINQELAYYTSLTAELEGKLAYYIVNADGLEEINNSLWTTPIHDKPVELHLMDNIDYTGKVWTPLNTIYDSELLDTTWSNITLLDGHNFTISNLEIDPDWTSNSIGFFASVGNTTTQNITFDSCHLEDEDNQNAGMIYGYVFGKSKIINTTVSNTYIGANKKAATFVGVVDSGKMNTDPEAYDLMACVELSNCTSYECTIVNKDRRLVAGDDIDIYLGGAVAWVRYHDTGNRYDGYLDIDDDPNNKMYITNIHFNWQQEATEATDGFEVGMIFLYDHYRQCNSYTNVVVHYEGE